MDDAFIQTCARVCPPMNAELMGGYLLHEIHGMGSQDEQQRRVDETVRRAFDGRFNGRLRVGDLVQCSSTEAYQYAIKPRNTERSFEIAHSDVYLVRQPMLFDGEPFFDIYLYLLAPRYGAIAHLSRTLYSFRPTIADKVISPENKLIFVRLDQYRMNLLQLSHPISVNGRQLMDAMVTWGQIHKSSKEKKVGIKSKAKSCLVHYLLGHYGYTKMFEKYLGYVPEYGDKEKINVDNYPADKWVIVETSHKHAQPVSCAEYGWKPTELRLAVPIEKWDVQMRSFVMSLFYVVDSFPSTMQLDKMDHLNSWRLTLGQILFSPSLTVPRILMQVEEHFNSSDTYMDSESIYKLKQNGHNVDSFHDLLALLAGKFTELLGNSASGNLYGKYLDTLRDVLDPVIKTINSTKYELMDLEQKPNFTPNKIRDIMSRNLRSGAIFEIIRVAQLVEAVASSTDHPYFKMTGRLSTSDRSPGGRTKARLVLDDRHYITTSRMEVGSILNLAKHMPILEGHANPWILLDLMTGTILENPATKDELAEVDAKLLDKRGRN